MKDAVLIPIFIMNLIAFGLCVFDKAAAKAEDRRIPEKTLLSVAAAFGSYGMFAGMYLVRHKTKHAKFVITVPLLMLVHTLILYAVFRPM